MPGTPLTPILTDKDRKALTWDRFQVILPWDRFCADVLDHGLSDRAAFMITNFGEKDANGLAGRIQQLYRVAFWCMKKGPNPIGPGGVDVTRGDDETEPE